MQGCKIQLKVDLLGAKISMELLNNKIKQRDL